MVRRFGLRIGLAVAANAVALVVAAVLLDDMDIGGPISFVVAVAVFSFANVIVLPIVALLTARFVTRSLGLVSLLANAVTLAMTDLLSDGIDVHGVTTYVVAVVVIWIANFVVDVVPGPWRRARRRGRRSELPG